MKSDLKGATLLGLHCHQRQIQQAVLPDLSKPNNEAFVRKTLYNELVTKVNVICTRIRSTSRIVNETQYDSDKQGLQKKIEKDIDRKMPNTSGLFKKTNYNTKMIQLENKIPSVTGYYCFSQYQRHRLKTKYQIFLISGPNLL